MDRMRVAGIQHVTTGQLRDWRTAGLVPKLIGHLTRSDGVLVAGVELRAYRASDLFASVLGKGKAIRVTTDVVGEITAVGCGAEPRATAAAALKDFEHILAAAR